MFHTKGSTAARLLEIINAGGTQAQAIMEFFAPICPCDPGAWVKQKLQQNDPEIVATVQALIARPAESEPGLASTSPWVGFMISSQCVNGTLWGQFAGGGSSAYAMEIPAVGAC